MKCRRCIVSYLGILRSWMIRIDSSWDWNRTKETGRDMVPLRVLVHIHSVLRCRSRSSTNTTSWRTLESICRSSESRRNRAETERIERNERQKLPISVLFCSNVTTNGSECKSRRTEKNEKGRQQWLICCDVGEESANEAFRNESIRKALCFDCCLFDEIIYSFINSKWLLVFTMHTREKKTIWCQLDQIRSQSPRWADAHWAWTSRLRVDNRRRVFRRSLFCPRWKCCSWSQRDNRNDRSKHTEWRRRSWKREREEGDSHLWTAQFDDQSIGNKLDVLFHGFCIHSHQWTWQCIGQKLDFNIDSISKNLFDTFHAGFMHDMLKK